MRSAKSLRRMPSGRQCTALRSPAAGALHAAAAVATSRKASRESCSRRAGRPPRGLPATCRCRGGLCHARPACAAPLNGAATTHCHPPPPHSQLINAANDCCLYPEHEVSHRTASITCHGSSGCHKPWARQQLCKLRRPSGSIGAPGLALFPWQVPDSGFVLPYERGRGIHPHYDQEDAFGEVRRAAGVLGASSGA